MQLLEYEIEAAYEKHHWWFIGRRRLFARVIERLHLPAGSAAADIGTSTGANLQLLEDLGFTRPIGVDSSPVAVEFCKHRGRDDVRLGDACQLPIPDGSLQLVLATDVLEHIPDDARALAELYRVLAPGGRLLITVPAFDSLREPPTINTGHLRRYRLKSLIAMVEHAGFKVDLGHYFNFILCPLIFMIRNIVRCLGMSVRSESEIGSEFVNAALVRIFRWDIDLTSVIRPPFGVSALVLARKDGLR